MNSTSLLQCFYSSGTCCTCTYFQSRRQAPTFAGCYASMWCDFCENTRSIKFHLKDFGQFSTNTFRGTGASLVPVTQSAQLTWCQSKDVISVDDQRHITLTVVLLHALGMFHEDAEQRVTSGLYHGVCHRDIPHIH